MNSSLSVKVLSKNNYYFNYIVVEQPVNLRCGNFILLSPGLDLSGALWCVSRFLHSAAISRGCAPYLGDTHTDLINM